MKKRHKKIQFWDDERSIGNGIIVTLAWGWSFEPMYHEGVKGFDTVKSAMLEIKSSYICRCDVCEANKKMNLKYGL